MPSASHPTCLGCPSSADGPWAGRGGKVGSVPPPLNRPPPTPRFSPLNTAGSPPPSLSQLRQVLLARQKRPFLPDQLPGDMRWVPCQDQIRHGVQGHFGSGVHLLVLRSRLDQRAAHLGAELLPVLGNLFCKDPIEVYD